MVSSDANWKAEFDDYDATASWLWITSIVIELVDMTSTLGATGFSGEIGFPSVR